MENSSKMELNDKKDWQRWQGEQSSGLSDAMLRCLWESSSGYKTDFQPDEEKGLAALKARMEQPQSVRVVRLSPLKVLLRVAAGIALLAVGIWAFKHQMPVEGDLMAATTSANATKQLSFSDGSAVLLNHSSKLEHQEAFTVNERRVKLHGEAFFQVSRDENRPFVIETANAEVTVLGTSFNVRSYPDDSFFEVFVESGKVRVSFAEGKQQVELTKGEFVRIGKNDNKIIRGVDAAAMPLAWRTGIISFKGQPIPTILQGIERLFEVELTLKNTGQEMDCLQTLTIQKGKLEEAMNALKASCPNLKITIKGKSAYEVSGSCCE